MVGMKRYRVLKGTLIGLALGYLGATCARSDLDAAWCLFNGALAGAIIAGLAEFIGRCWPLDPPSWSR